MHFFVICALAALLTGLLLPLLGHFYPAVHIHAVFALGVLPLILAAITHFAPVLTRTPGSKNVIVLPVFALLGGIAILLVLASGETLVWRAIAALPGLAASIGLIIWMRRLTRKALGATHPGLRWYLAGLACLSLALLAIVLMPWLPEWALALKRFHLHLNLFGLIGLSAIGTLQVLLPTATGLGDPDAVTRLHTDILPALAGSFLIATGAAYLPWLAFMGTALWMFVLYKLTCGWLKRFRSALFSLHGATPLLAAATLGFGFILLAGVAHGWAAGTSAAMGHAFTYGFLFPLISGAAGQLLPVWIRPGMQQAWHGTARDHLTRWSGARALLFLSAELVAFWSGKLAALLALTALLPFVLAAIRVILSARQR